MAELEWQRKLDEGDGDSARPAKRGQDLFVAQRGVYRKKLNPVGDKASYLCFQARRHARIINVIVNCLCRCGCSLRCARLPWWRCAENVAAYRCCCVSDCLATDLPPYLDTLQDQLFALYGACGDDPLIPGASSC